ncbi:MAG: cytochrome c3 family protein [Qipengyuania sp.]
MSFLIRTVDYTATGREIIREREVAGSKLTLGRATTNDIVLPDLAVEQHHATLEDAGGGRLRVASAGTLGFLHEGRSTKDTSFDASEGGELTFSTYRLRFSRESEGQVAVTIRKSERAEGAHDAVRRFALASALPGKRAMAWTAFGAILLAFLAVPIWSHLKREQREADYDRAGQVAMDASWSTGALSLAHHGLEDNCEACHVEPFVAVRDETCLSCHQAIGDHAERPRLASSRGPMGTGDALQWAVADMFGKEGPEACTTCHTEHEGPTRMEPVAQQFCAECHDTMDARLTDTQLANAGDFGANHPQFQAVVWAKPGQEQLARIPLGANPRENHGLRFPHDLHLQSGGGVARMARSLSEYGAALQCSDCHRKAPDGVGFQPIEMEEDCESCHSLVYDKVGSTFRTLRHGDVEQMRADLIAMDRAPRRPITTGRSRPGQFARGGRYYQDFGRPQRNYIGITQALSRNGVCGECHIPTLTKGRPDIVPVELRRSYFVNGRFDHAAHRQEECSTCHKADESNSATDVILPGIETCRTCHLGENARRAEVPSGCAMCHSYHPPSGRKPDDHPEISPKQVARISRIGR